MTLDQAIRLAYDTPAHSPIAKLRQAYAKTIVATWSASCATDGYVDLKPHYAAEKAALAALNAHYELTMVCNECDNEWSDYGSLKPVNCSCCGRPVYPEIAQD